MSAEDLIQAGMAAVKSGDREAAATFFARAVKVDPSSEDGWYWLGVCCFEPAQREYCFRRVLALNPYHAKAKQQLERQSAPKSPSPFTEEPDFSSISAAPKNSAVAEPPNTPIPVAPPVAPFIDSPEPVLASVERPSRPVPTPEPAPPKPAPPAFGADQRKGNRALIAIAILVPSLICCGLTGIYASRSGLLAQYAPPELLAILTPPVTFTSPTFATAPTFTPVPPTTIPSPRPTVVYAPQYGAIPCPFDVGPSVEVTCGYLIVPEDRTGDPADTIRLAVAVYHSRSASPAADPVLFLQGGPGAAAIQLTVDAFDFLVDPFLARRDFIVYDQRGTGFSDPTLNCEELTKAYLNDIHGLTPLSTRELVYSNAFLSCSGLMDAQGIQLQAYTTAESAADVRDLLSVLGYEKASLYGASYGTRLAQVIMRDYPEIVQSAVLDSVVPVDTSLFGKYPEAIRSGLQTLFNNCALDPGCNNAYPDLETVFWDLISHLDANPETITTSNYPTGTITETVTGSTVMNIILGSIKSSQFISTAPQSIYRFKEGDFSALILMQSSLPFMFDGINTGLFISVTCHEQVLGASPEELETASNQQIIREYAWLPFYGDAADVVRTCNSWGATGPYLGEDDAVVSEIPSLIITGSYDPTTPPMYAQQIAGGLSHSFYFEFPDLGHTPTAADDSGCALDTVLRFLDDPGVEPNRDCMNDLPEVEFVLPYTGEPALELKTVSVDGVSVKVPKDWYSLSGGFYLRGTSVFDITEVSVFQVPLSSQEIQDWFNLEAYGYRGLDSALIETERREANGLTWRLYSSTSYGRPVDIAMADNQGASIVVALFSNDDEHAALHETLYLPMIDSARP